MLQSNNRILTLSGFNAVLFIQNAAQLGDIIKRMQSDVCQPDVLLTAAIVLIPTSLVLQFFHVLCMIIHQKPDNELRATDEEAHTQRMEAYRTKLMWENILAAIVILLNILISYSIVEQIRDFDHKSCSFYTYFSTTVVVPL